MVYDEAREVTLLFGGFGPDGVPKGDTWEWDGTAWSRAATEGPSPRAPFGLAYHEGRDQVLLMGGQTPREAYGDTWTWDGARWTPLEVEGPEPRGFQAMTYDAAGERVLLFGGREGHHLHRDLWSWDGDRWRHLDGAGPRRRGIFASAWDRARSSPVIHGSGDRVDGTWVLEASTWTWSETTGWVERGPSTSGPP